MVTDNSGATFTASVNTVVHPVVIKRTRGVWRDGLRLAGSVKTLDQASQTTPSLVAPRDAALATLVALVQTTHNKRSSSLGTRQQRDYRDYLSVAKQDITAGHATSATDNLLVALRIVLG